MKVNGPYTHTTGRLAGRKYVSITYDDGTRTSMLYSRWLMQEHLGRTLLTSEHVDHKDEDPTNDTLNNLQILSLSENSKKSARLRRSITYVTITCPVCGDEAVKQKRHVDHNKKLGKAGPYCGRRCAGKAHH